MSQRRKPDPSTFIRWDEATKLKVATQVRNLVASGERLTGTLISKAQEEVLPENLRRKFVTPRDKWLVELLAKLEVPGFVVAVPPEPMRGMPSQELLSRPVATLGLMPTARKEVRDNGISTLGELIALDPKMFTKRALGQIEKGLAGSRTGLTIGMSLSKEDDLSAAEIPMVQSPVQLPRPSFIDSDKLTEVMMVALRPMLHEIADNIVDVIGNVALQSASIISGRVQETLLAKSGVQLAKVAKKKIVVIGPLNPEAAMLQNMFQDKVNLCTYNKDQSLNTLDSYLKNADEVIVMTSNCEHAATGKVKSLFKGKPIYVNGGYNSVKDVITKVM